MNQNAQNYEALTLRITSAGFYVQPPHDEDPFRRICPCTRYQPGQGYSGNSFWIACVANRWFLGTWGGKLYLIPAVDQIAAFTIEWLAHKPTGTASDFEPWIVSKFHLEPFEHDQFEKLLEK